MKRSRLSSLALYRLWSHTHTSGWSSSDYDKFLTDHPKKWQFSDIQAFAESLHITHYTIYCSSVFSKLRRQQQQQQLTRYYTHTYTSGQQQPYHSIQHVYTDKYNIVYIYSRGGKELQDSCGKRAGDLPWGGRDRYSCCKRQYGSNRQRREFSIFSLFFFISFSIFLSSSFPLCIYYIIIQTSRTERTFYVDANYRASRDKARVFCSACIYYQSDETQSADVSSMLYICICGELLTFFFILYTYTKTLWLRNASAAIKCI